MSSSYELLCYTREATGREKANNEDIAYSMHLALRADGAAQWEPLNENYGIFFAAGVPIQAATAESRRACVAAAHFVADPFDEAHPATDAVAYGAVMPGIDITLKSLKNPYLFRLADGRFALAAAPSVARPPLPVPRAAASRMAPSDRRSCWPSATI